MSSAPQRFVKQSLLKVQADPTATVTHLPALHAPDVQSPLTAQRSPTLDW